MCIRDSLIGIAIEQAYPRDIGCFGYPTEKLRKLIRAVKIKTVSCDILCYDHKLFDSELFKLLDVYKRQV